MKYKFDTIKITVEIGNQKCDDAGGHYWGMDVAPPIKRTHQFTFLTCRRAVSEVVEQRLITEILAGFKILRQDIQDFNNSFRRIPNEK